MTTVRQLESAVLIVNTFNRTAGPAIVQVVACDICGERFASQVGAATLARHRGLGRICPAETCQRKAMLLRKRGERKAKAAAFRRW